MAVNGRLYDVTDSRMWGDGVPSRRNQVGEDPTGALVWAPHGADVLDRVPMIGEMVGAPVSARPAWREAQRLFMAFT
ncbi:MAG: cytochrome B5 [Anaerolineae bacterium]